MNPLISGKAI